MEKIFYSRSLEAKLRLNQECLPVYQQLKDVCAVHKHVNSRISFHKDTITYRRHKVAIIKMSKKYVSIYLALDPEEYKDYNVKNVGDKKSYQEVPSKLTIKSRRALKRACYLLEEALLKVGANKLVTAKLIDYKEIYQPQSFEQLLADKKIKQYVGKLPNFNKEMVNVHFTCKLVYAAMGKAEELYIITNVSNWDISKAIKMERVSENVFEVDAKFEKGTKLEFKVARSKDWSGIEKGIWADEVKNHNYIIDGDLDVEDFVHNF